MLVHIHTCSSFQISDKPVAEFEAGLGVQPAVPGVRGALTSVIRVLGSKAERFVHGFTASERKLD